MRPPFPARRKMNVRVLVVDDHPAFRRALTSALRMVDGVEVAGGGGGGGGGGPRGGEGGAAPRPPGTAAGRETPRRRPPLPVVILTAHADPGVEREALQAGASGFLAKGIGLEELLVVLPEAGEPATAGAR